MSKNLRSIYLPFESENKDDTLKRPIMDVNVLIKFFLIVSGLILSVV